MYVDAAESLRAGLRGVPPTSHSARGPGRTSSGCRVFAQAPALQRAVAEWGAPATALLARARAALRASSMRSRRQDGPPVCPVCQVRQ